MSEYYLFFALFMTEAFWDTFIPKSFHEWTMTEWMNIHIHFVTEQLSPVHSYVQFSSFINIIIYQLLSSVYPKYNLRPGRGSIPLSTEREALSKLVWQLVAKCLASLIAVWFQHSLMQKIQSVVTIQKLYLTRPAAHDIVLSYFEEWNWEQESNKPWVYMFSCGFYLFKPGFFGVGYSAPPPWTGE